MLLFFSVLNLYSEETTAQEARVFPGRTDLLFPASPAWVLRGERLQHLRLVSPAAEALHQRPGQRVCQHETGHERMCESSVHWR